MEPGSSSLIKNIHLQHFKKPFKEDILFQFKSQKSANYNIYPMKNFVPIIKPMKAQRRPSPLQLNPESSDEKKNFKANSYKKNDIESNCFDPEKRDLTSSESSEFSSTEKDKRAEIENLKKDFSLNDKSPIIKFKNKIEDFSF